MIAKHEMFLDGFLRKCGQKSCERYLSANFVIPVVKHKFNTQMEKYIRDVFAGDERAAIDYMQYAKKFMNTQEFFKDL